MNQGRLSVNLIIDLLADNPLVRRYDVLLHEQTDVKFQLKLRIEFVDGSVLFTNDYVGVDRQKYAFHWQRNDETSLVRWDNATHYPQLTSFPHHRHDYRSGSEIVMESFNISLAEVLTYIQRQLTPHP